MIRGYKANDFNEIEKIYNLCRPDELRYEEAELTLVNLSNDTARLHQFSASQVYVYEITVEPELNSTTSTTIAGFITLFNNSIGWIYVHPNFRRLGIANELLTYVISLSSDIPLILNTVKSNKAALNLYKKHNFTVVDEFIIPVDGYNVDVLTLRT